MNILFVCKHNRFRSKVAEAFFLHYNKNKKINVKSAGVSLDMMRPFVAQSVHDEMRKRGVKIYDDRAHSVNPEVLKWANRIVIVADNVLFDGFSKNKIEVWKIKDTSQEDLKGIKKIVDSIDRRVRVLVRRVNV